jgi:hypothetical protein
VSKIHRLSWADYLCEAREVDQRKTQDMRRVDLEIDGLSVYALVASRNSCGFRFNLPLHLNEVIPAPSRMVVELGPFLIDREAPLGTSLCLRIAVGGNVDEL